MRRMIYYELYRLLRDKVFWLVLCGILLINFVIFSGQIVTLEGFIQKSFLTIALSTLYVSIFIGEEFEKKRIMYQLLTGNSRTKILLAKLFISILVIEVQLFLFPMSQILLLGRISRENDQFTYSLIISFILLGIYLATLCILITFAVKNSGMAAGVTIVFYLMSMLIMNNLTYGAKVMRFCPIGINQLIAKNQLAIMSGIMPMLLWMVIQTYCAIILFYKSEL